ncbi:hypothetical protein EDD29_2964 [Actinocorallia herbida]|uniref:Uncharacterized protein n=1 Tax=Actinocorallia herbida TaxID=58109 RepID=A0A3N1CVU9_9ACTN|nr:hypothetical protein [Actinocorallia herbida]ROO85420.1 hypothetical protein EDD29_2964 [Actinocorallia herbida]
MSPARDPEPSEYQLPHGVNLVCVVCAHELFERDTRKLNSTGMEFMNLAWANRNATLLICARCRHIHWFDA